MTETKSSLETSLAPDGGWGWVVVFGSFMIHGLVNLRSTINYLAHIIKYIVCCIRYL